MKDHYLLAFLAGWSAAGCIVGQLTGKPPVACALYMAAAILAWAARCHFARKP